MKDRYDTLIALAAGVVIGANWPRIKKAGTFCYGFVNNKVSNAYNTTVAFLAKRRSEKSKPEKQEPKPEPVKKQPEATQEQILSILRDAPKGKTLTEMAVILRVPFKKISARVKKLVSKDKVRQEQEKLPVYYKTS